jgi:hypothetical protein
VVDNLSILDSIPARLPNDPGVWKRYPIWFQLLDIST